MQNAAFAAAGLDWTYQLLDVQPAQLPAAIDGLRAPDVRGANVTIPYKQSVMDQLDVIDPAAVKARAVNTIVRDDGRLNGFNTDIAAMQAAFSEAGVEPLGAHAVVLGTGGAARAASAALEGAHVTFVSRHPEDSDLAGRVIGWDDPALSTATRAADVLVNATPLGRHEEMPLRPAALPANGAVIDLVYVTGGTPLVRKSRSFGLKTVDGWEILLRQGAAAFELWTGKPAPLDAMRETLQP
jgi:shikimate dehydrogenase